MLEAGILPPAAKFNLLVLPVRGGRPNCAIRMRTIRLPLTRAREG